MNIAICDDIWEYRNTIKKYIEQYCKEHSIVTNIMEFDNGNSLINNNYNFDIVFLDIELGEDSKDGITVAKTLQINRPNTVILIVTSYRQYLDDAMDLHVTRYIDKPITQKRIISAFEKSIEIINNNSITLHTKTNNIIKIKKSSIIFAESHLKKVTIYTTDSKYIIRETMKNLRSLCSGSYFAIPHNSFIINMNYIVNYNREFIVLEYENNKNTIPIAAGKQPEFRRQFIDFVEEGVEDD